MQDCRLDRAEKPTQERDLHRNDHRRHRHCRHCLCRHGGPETPAYGSEWGALRGICRCISALSGGWCQSIIGDCSKPMGRFYTGLALAYYLVSSMYRMYYGRMSF